MEQGSEGQADMQLVLFLVPGSVQAPASCCPPVADSIQNRKVPSWIEVATATGPSRLSASNITHAADDASGPVRSQSSAHAAAGMAFDVEGHSTLVSASACKWWVHHPSPCCRCEEVTRTHNALHLQDLNHLVSAAIASRTGANVYNIILAMSGADGTSCQPLVTPGHVSLAKQGLACWASAGWLALNPTCYLAHLDAWALTALAQHYPDACRTRMQSRCPVTSSLPGPGTAPAVWTNVTLATLVMPCAARNAMACNALQAVFRCADQSQSFIWQEDGLVVMRALGINDMARIERWSLFGVSFDAEACPTTRSLPLRGWVLPCIYSLQPRLLQSNPSHASFSPHILLALCYQMYNAACCGNARADAEAVQSNHRSSPQPPDCQLFGQAARCRAQWPGPHPPLLTCFLVGCTAGGLTTPCSYPRKYPRAPHICPISLWCKQDVTKLIQLDTDLADVIAGLRGGLSAHFVHHM
ncbi:hypothetical protein HaLaN_07313 [Haematococcus lacustris]|uniref:Uncharacterized protein n=1 Tax=Haematococcus lacustris TaxID=44745 RepID=A0A699YVX5_HAELA|nr:hypothetical protein HaLaN_07313 [Haematococcus lacustris]